MKLTEPQQLTIYVVEMKSADEIPPQSKMLPNHWWMVYPPLKSTPSPPWPHAIPSCDLPKGDIQRSSEADVKGASWRTRNPSLGDLISPSPKPQSWKVPQSSGTSCGGEIGTGGGKSPKLEPLLVLWVFHVLKRPCIISKPLILLFFQGLGRG